MTDVPFAIGEEFASKWAFLPYIERGLTNFMRVDVCNVGGLTEAMKVAGWAEAHYIDLMPHNPLGPICTAATIHLAAAVANFAWLEVRTSPTEQLGFDNCGAVSRSSRAWRATASPCPTARAGRRVQRDAGRATALPVLGSAPPASPRRLVHQLVKLCRTLLFPRETSSAWRTCTPRRSRRASSPCSCWPGSCWPLARWRECGRRRDRRGGNRPGRDRPGGALVGAGGHGAGGGDRHRRGPRQRLRRGPDLYRATPWRRG